jgi:hypothetical protein
MKRIIYIMSALCMTLLAVSCAKDIAEVPAGETTVNVRMQLPSDIATKAFSDGTTATSLSYAVYESGGSKALITSEDQVSFTSLAASLSIHLALGKSYDIIFWADCGSSSPYKFNPDSQTITVDYASAACNDENRDAFFGSIKDMEVTDSMTVGVTLSRPFAQVNVCTSDRAKATLAGLSLTSSSLTLTGNVYSTLNLLTGAVSDEVAGDLVFAASAIPSGETLLIAGDQYDVIAMTYALVSSDKALTECAINFKGTYLGSDYDRDIAVHSLPVQRNYRTNSYGALLIGDVQIDVNISSDYIKDEGTGSLDDPYAISKALALINAGKNTSSYVYVHGFVSEITEVNTTDGYATYSISDVGGTSQIEVYKGLGLGGAKFASTEDIALGDEVVVYGVLALSGTTPVIGEGSYIYTLGGTSKSGTDSMTATALGLTTTFASFADVKLSTPALYSGFAKSSNSGAIQIGESNNCAIFTTKSGGKAKKLTVEWTSGNGANRTLNIYGSNKAYSAASDLYDSAKCGDLIGTLTFTSSTENAKELEVSGTYSYIGIRPAANTIYLNSVKVDWE